MAMIKCKMCGGDLTVVPGSSVAECEYCGSRQTVPMVDDEKKLVQFARANQLRANCDFDKAAGIYEAILADTPSEAEAYWGLVLCKYGIEYVTDPVSGRKIPTCHRTSYDNVLKDSNFDQAYENADLMAQKEYRAQAKQLEEIRRGIIEVSAREKPYDVFICYKETDPEGNRTPDSVMAQDIYDALTAKGYRVFFSRISLEDKLGQEYEPYIFAALNSAKVMLAVGTCYEYYNSVWVKNEWSRYLKLMARDKNKHLIPCFQNLDPEDMPEQFVRLQAQDMGKIGAIQDLTRGIEKLLGSHYAAKKVSNAGGDNTLVRAKGFLERGDWENARIYFNRCLDADPESGAAAMGLLLATWKSRNLTQFTENVSRELTGRVLYLDPNETEEKIRRYIHPGADRSLQEENALVENEQSRIIEDNLKKDRNMVYHIDKTPEFMAAIQLAEDGERQQLQQSRDAIEKNVKAACQKLYQGACGNLRNEEDQIAVHKFKRLLLIDSNMQEGYLGLLLAEYGCYSLEHLEAFLVENYSDFSYDESGIREEDNICIAHGLMEGCQPLHLDPAFQAAYSHADQNLKHHLDALEQKVSDAIRAGCDQAIRVLNRDLMDANTEAQAIAKEAEGYQHKFDQMEEAKKNAGPVRTKQRIRSLIFWAVGILFCVFLFSQLDGSDGGAHMPINMTWVEDVTGSYNLSAILGSLVNFLFCFVPMIVLRIVNSFMNKKGDLVLETANTDEETVMGWKKDLDDCNEKARGKKVLISRIQQEIEDVQRKAASLKH